MDMYVGHIAKSREPLRMLEHARPVDIIHHAHSTITSARTDDGPDLRVIDRLLKICQALGICARILIIGQADGAAEFYLQPPALKYLNGWCKLFMSDLAGCAEDDDSVTGT